MKYLLVQYGMPLKRKILCLSETEFNHIREALSQRHSCYEVCKPPSQQSLRRWRRGSYARAICGCRISSKRGSRCNIHNVQSWLTVFDNPKEKVF